MVYRYMYTVPASTVDLHGGSRQFTIDLRIYLGIQYHNYRSYIESIIELFFYSFTSIKLERSLKYLDRCCVHVFKADQPVYQPSL